MNVKKECFFSVTQTGMKNKNGMLHLVTAFVILFFSFPAFSFSSSNLKEGMTDSQRPER